MMIAHTPFAAAPAAGAGFPLTAGTEAAATAFTLTLQSLVQGQDGGLTAPLIDGASAAPAAPAVAAAPEQTLFSLAAPDAASPQPPVTPGAAGASLAILADIAPPTLAQPIAGEVASPQTAAAATPLPQAAEAQAEPGEPAPVLADAGAQPAPLPDSQTPPAAAAATQATPPLATLAIAVPPKASTSGAEPAAEASGKKPGKTAPQGQPARTSPVKLAGDSGMEPRTAMAAAPTPEYSLAAIVTAGTGPSELPADALPVETDSLPADRIADAMPVPAQPQVERATPLTRDLPAAPTSSGPTTGAVERSALVAAQASANVEALASLGTAAPAATPGDAASFSLRADSSAPDAVPADTTGLPPQLVGQTISGAAIRPVNVHQIYPAHNAAPAGTVNAQPGRIGREMGVEIARRVSVGQDEMLIRLNPQEMGRIEVRLSFDEAGAVRAVVASESPAALEMLRRETGELARSLADAGVRSDAQSFRFDRNGGDGFGQRGQNGGSGQQQRPQGGPAFQGGAEEEQDASTYRQLRSSGQVNLIA